MTLIYLVGPPGAGKSTAMERLIVGFERGDAAPVPGFAPLVVEPLLRPGYGARAATYLGRHRPDFSGTDALSMGVLPAAVRWAQEAPLPDLTFGEGARLAHGRFLVAYATRAPVHLIRLIMTPGIAAARRAARGSGQSEAWARGQATRVENLCSSPLPGVTLHEVWGGRRADEVADAIRGRLVGVGIALP